MYRKRPPPPSSSLGGAFKPPKVRNEAKAAQHRETVYKWPRPKPKAKVDRNGAVSASGRARRATTIGKRYDEDGGECLSQEESMRRHGNCDGIVRVAVSGFCTLPPALTAHYKTPGGVVSAGLKVLKKRTLGMSCRNFIQIGKQGMFKKPDELGLNGAGAADEGDEGGSAASHAEEKKEFEPLILWEDPDMTGHKIEVDPILAAWLRPHQREGVEFMYNCVEGEGGFDGRGCILADDMGLGKTLQSIALLYTLLKQGRDPKNPTIPVAKRAIIVCPTSLVKNWDAELKKWLPDKRGQKDTRGRYQNSLVNATALSETSRDAVRYNITQFLNSRVIRCLIVSYETFRIHVDLFDGKKDCCDLLICDEAHRLKNADTLTNQALNRLPVRRRVLLSGTPMQNDLEEFFAMVDFTNPGILGDPTHFKSHYMRPLLNGREPDASDKAKRKMQTRQAELSRIVNRFILRRTNTLNAQHLPSKLVQVVCCKMTPVQGQIYNHLVQSKDMQAILNGKQTRCLSSIGALIKCCNHPQLLAEANITGGSAHGLEEVAELLQQAGCDLGPKKTARRGGGCRVDPSLSGKMETLFKLLRSMRDVGDDRIVVVSNYTATLDLIATMCREHHWPNVRLDGSVTASRRMKLVDNFNDPTANQFVFLLSSKAGGCGLNLIGANRLVLFDPDWNPAVDKQAAARCWRDGQRKRCYTYRFVTTGTIEEKIFQRQLSKEGLQSMVDDEDAVNSLSSRDLRDLFTIQHNTCSDTHDKLQCARCRGAAAARQAHGIGVHNSALLSGETELLKRFLDELKAEPNAEPFLVPVDPPAYPQYYEIIRQPTDLRTVEGHLDGGAYKKIQEFHSELRRMFRNARKFFAGEGVDEGKPPGTAAAVLTKADALQDFFDAKWKPIARQLFALRQAHSSEQQAQSASGSGSGSGAEESNMEPFQPQIGMPKEEALNLWAHHYSAETADDECLKISQEGPDSNVSFVFGLEVTWNNMEQQRLVDEEAQAEKEAAEKAERLNAERLANEEGKKQGNGDEDNSEDGDESEEEKPRATKEERKKSSRSKAKFLSARGSDSSDVDADGGPDTESSDDDFECVQQPARSRRTSARGKDSPASTKKSSKFTFSRKGFEHADVGDDGNCFFRALAAQLECYGLDEERHLDAREATVAYMRENKEVFQQHVDLDSIDGGTYEDYVEEMAQDTTWVEGEAELIAAKRRFDVSLTVLDATDSERDQIIDGDRVGGGGHVYVVHHSHKARGKKQRDQLHYSVAKVVAAAAAKAGKADDEGGVSSRGSRKRAKSQKSMGEKAGKNKKGASKAKKPKKSKKPKKPDADVIAIVSSHDEDDGVRQEVGPAEQNNVTPVLDDDEDDALLDGEGQRSGQQEVEEQEPTSVQKSKRKRKMRLMESDDEDDDCAPVSEGEVEVVEVRKAQQPPADTDKALMFGRGAAVIYHCPDDGITYDAVIAKVDAETRTYSVKADDWESQGVGEEFLEARTKQKTKKRPNAASAGRDALQTLQQEGNAPPPKKKRRKPPSKAVTQLASHCGEGAHWASPVCGRGRGRRPAKDMSCQRWACTVCTLENSAKDTECSMCGATKSAQAQYFNPSHKTEEEPSSSTAGKRKRCDGLEQEDQEQEVQEQEEQEQQEQQEQEEPEQEQEQGGLAVLNYVPMFSSEESSPEPGKENQGVPADTAPESALSAKAVEPNVPFSSTAGTTKPVRRISKLKLKRSKTSQPN